MAEEYEPTERHGGLTPGRTKALMVLVAVITVIAMWLVPVDQEQAPPSLPPLPSAPATTEKLPLPSTPDTPEELSVPPPTGGISVVINGGDRARAFIAAARAGGTQPDAGMVLATAERMQGEGSLEDAYLLYRFAARHGQPQAALILGTQADPAFHASVSSYLPEPDSGQAFKWYSVAAAAGSEEAAARLQALRKLVQQDAAAGDEQARRLLLQWR